MAASVALGSLVNTPVSAEGYAYVPLLPIDPHVEAITPYRESPELPIALSAGAGGLIFGTAWGGLIGVLALAFGYGVAKGAEIQAEQEFEALRSGEPYRIVGPKY
jgi:hypothetical protein